MLDIINHTDDAEDVLARACKIATALHSSPYVKKKIIGHYLDIGMALHNIRCDYPSTKAFNLRIKIIAPELLLLDASTRSDSLWLYRAMNGLIKCDLLSILGVDSLVETGRTHPSAIRRLYREKAQIKR